MRENGRLEMMPPTTEQLLDAAGDADLAARLAELPRTEGAGTPPPAGWTLADVLDGAAFFLTMASILVWGAL